MIPDTYYVPDTYVPGISRQKSIRTYVKFRPWTHTSDDSYIYQLSLVVATATVSLIIVLRSRIIVGVSKNLNKSTNIKHFLRVVKLRTNPELYLVHAPYGVYNKHCPSCVNP